MAQKYVKCTYGKGLFDNERIVNIGKDSIFVAKTSIIPKEGTDAQSEETQQREGYIQAEILETGTDKALIYIQDLGAHSTICLSVPKEDLFSLEDIVCKQ